MSYDNIRKLRIKTHTSISKLAKICGVSESRYKTYEMNDPPAGMLISLADFYHVSVDYLLGRENCDLSKILEEFRTLKTDAYEAYLYSAEDVPFKPFAIPLTSYIPPYPYNLINDVFGEDWDFPLTEDQAEGLDEAIDMLDPRSRDILLDHYEFGLSYKECEEKYRLTSSQIRTRVYNSLKKLRHPDRSSLIRYGAVGCEIKNKMISYEKEIDKLCLLREKYEKEKELYENCTEKPLTVNLE